MTVLSPFVRSEIERLHVKEDGVVLPIPRYFVSLVDDVGCKLFGVWNGAVYSEALTAAADWELPVVDLTGRLQ